MKKRIMSFNIWGDYFKNPVEVRENDILEVVTTYSPDVLAMQEATKNFYNSKLFAALREQYTFVEPENAPENNFVPLIWRKDRFTQLECGFEYFNDTPDNTKGITWAVLEDSDGSRFAVLCTHFWWKFVGEPEHDGLRVSNARILTDTARKLCEKYSIPAVALGDLNSSGDVPSIVYLREAGWGFSQASAPDSDPRSSHHGDPVKGEDEKWHGTLTERDLTHSIDHIIYRGDIKPTKFRVVVDRFALDASDHSPIFADFE